MKPPEVEIAPSLICLDLCRLEEEVRQLEAMGIERLHVDLLDGHFSPSMPIGLEVVRQLRRRTKLAFDVHLMVEDNEFFIRECLAIGAERICFHLESARHADRLLTLIRQGNVQAGVALTPATPPEALEYLLERLDFVLLMLINPGYAGHAGEQQVPCAVRKVAACRRFLDERHRPVPILVDGRVSHAVIPDLVAAGAGNLVGGTACLFIPGAERGAMLAQTRQAIAAGQRQAAATVKPGV